MSRAGMRRKFLELDYVTKEQMFDDKIVEN